MAPLPPILSHSLVDHPVLSAVCFIGAVFCTVQLVRRRPRGPASAQTQDAASARWDRTTTLYFAGALLLYGLGIAL